MAPTAVYRLRDASGALLYVGVSENPERRWEQHASTKSWWPQVASNSVEWFDTRDLAESAEAQAIKTEHAIHNVNGSPWAPGPRQLEVDEMLLTEVRANLSEACNVVRLQNRMIRIVHRTQNRAPQAAIVPPDFIDLIDGVGGLDAARDTLSALKAEIEAAGEAN